MNETITEIWRPISNHPFPKYAVSNLGRVRGPKGIKSGWVNGHGYVIVGLFRNKHARLHVLVAEAFIGSKPSGMDVNHKDGVKTNNRVDNLEYMTRSENCKHGFRLGLSYTPFRNFQGSKHPRAILSEEDARAIRLAYSNGSSRRSIATQYAISYYTVWDITTGRSWAHLGNLVT